MTSVGNAAAWAVERLREDHARQVVCPNPKCAAGLGEPCVWTWEPKKNLLGTPMRSVHPSRYTAAALLADETPRTP